MSWDPTAFLVKGIRVVVNTDHNLSTFEEIDAVELHGSLSPPPSTIIYEETVLDETTRRTSLTP